MAWPRRQGKDHPMWGKKHSLESRRKMSKAQRGENHPNWGKKRSPETRRKISEGHRKGDWEWRDGYSTKNGYVLVMRPEHPNADSKGYVLEHHLVMEKHLGRYLKPGEIVHHLNEIRDDNRIENLMLFPSRAKHIAFHRSGIRDEATKWERAFYRAVGFWLGERRKRLELGKGI